MDKYLEKLEYNKIIDNLCEYAVTYLGKDLASKLLPYSLSSDVKMALDETTESFIFIQRKSIPPLCPIPDITDYLNLLKMNGSLGLKGLLDLTSVLKLSRNLKEYFSQDIDTSFAEILTSYFSNLYTNIGIENDISNSIIDESTVSDNASPELYKIRKKQVKINSDIKDKLSSYLNKKFVQEPIITVRNGRFVIPVKQEFKNEVNGFVHDVSSTGSTVFIEPLSVFELNNDLNNLKLEENIEIEKIISSLSSKFYPIMDFIYNNLSLISKIDFAFSKAKYAISINANCPVINCEKFFVLKKARHPLINSSKVVPIDINVGKDFSSLIITGPNTGGKTVSLKTAGLLNLMGSSGLFIPAEEGGSIFVFDNIFADIGDEQSIAESLSTFSSHMSNIIDILNSSTSNSLVLLDELGSGTDPIEGASLAISILKNLYNKGCITIATTHYQEIKNFALTENGFENASTEFDLNTLSPTYKLLIGVPGKSMAFAISEKLGLDKSILDDAKLNIDKSTIDIETLLKSIYDDKLLIEKEKENVLNKSKEINEIKSSLELQYSNLEKDKKQLIDNAKNEAREILIDAKKEANEIINRISNSKDAKTANDLRISLNKKIQNLGPTLSSIENKNPISKEELNIGQYVFVKNFNQEGIVLSMPNKSNEVQVQIGSIKTKVNINNLEKSTKSNNHNLKTHNVLTTKTVSNEINVIGQNVDEACFAIDKFLDVCLLSGLNTVTIVHGKGTRETKRWYSFIFKKSPSCKVL